MPENASFCPECGSDASTGWSEDAKLQSLGVDPEAEGPEDEEVLRRDWENDTDFQSSTKPEALSWFWWMIAFGIVFLLLRRFL